eukprot:PhM_4_TR8443/c1_g1_i6/m.51323
MASMSPSMNRHSTCDHDTYGDDNDGDHQMQHPTECPIRNNNNKPSFRRNKPSAAQPAKIFRKELYKTKMCRAIMSGNTCVYGAECCYAHSPLELRSVEVNVCDGVPDGVGLSKKGSNQRARETPPQQQVPYCNSRLYRRRFSQQQDYYSILPPMPPYYPMLPYSHQHTLPQQQQQHFNSNVHRYIDNRVGWESYDSSSFYFYNSFDSNGTDQYNPTPVPPPVPECVDDQVVLQEAYDSMVAAMANQFLCDDDDE